MVTKDNMKNIKSITDRKESEKRIKMNKNEVIVKCNKCGHVLIRGKGTISIFGLGTSIECRACGNKYTFTDQDKILVK